MASWQTHLLNPVIFFYSRLFFRAKESPQVMRTRLVKLFTRTAEQLKSRFPKAEFTSVNLGGVPCEWVDASPEEKKPTVCYFHGGGYFMGSLETYRIFAMRLSYRCKVRVLMVDYRLAPEHPFPAAHDDALSVYLALRTQFPNEKLFLGGDSAGGGLAIATALSVKSQNQKLPDGIVAFSPWTDLKGESKPSGKRDAMFQSSATTLWAPFYVGRHDATDPRISPAYGDFSGMPPVLLQVSTHEDLYRDSIRVKEKIEACQGEVQLQSWPSVPHVWQVMFPFLPESKAALALAKTFLHR